MAAPTYNCPFSATAGVGAADYVMLCSEVLAANTNAGCALYNAKDEQCLLRQMTQGEVNKNKYGDVA